MLATKFKAQRESHDEVSIMYEPLIRSSHQEGRLLQSGKGKANHSGLVADVGLTMSLSIWSGQSYLPIAHCFSADSARLVDS